jgi:hypothetical protein
VVGVEEACVRSVRVRVRAAAAAERKVRRLRWFIGGASRRAWDNATARVEGKSMRAMYAWADWLR